MGRPSGAPLSPRRDRGQASVELIGVMPIVLLLMALLLQIGLTVYCALQAGNAARTAARAASQGDPGSPAGRDAVSTWLRDDADVQMTGASSARVRIEVPILFPGITTERLAVTRTADMPDMERN